VTYYDTLADLSLSVDDYSLERRSMDTSSGFTRVSTVVTLHGPDTEGRGEDVTYDTPDHKALLETHDFDLAGEFTFDDFSTHLDGIDLFPAGDPERSVSRHYRRWAFESAALDLALRQADTDLGSALGRSYDPVRFVVSTRLADPPTGERVEQWLDHDGTTEFKLDPTPAWDEALIERLAATDAVRVLDLKGLYEGTDVDVPADPEFYRRVVEGFTEAIVEDPLLTPETGPVFEGHEDRVAWDYPIHGVDDVLDRPWEPAWLNVKPSRFGTVESLLETIEYAEQKGITLYGGGQFELDVGRSHLHALASLFYADAPNDVAPSAYNRPEPTAGLPGSPLAPPEDSTGVRF